MRCPKCQKPVNDNDNFCMSCGTSLKQSLPEPASELNSSAASNSKRPFYKNGWFWIILCAVLLLSNGSDSDEKIDLQDNDNIVSTSSTKSLQDEWIESTVLAVKIILDDSLEGTGISYDVYYQDEIFTLNIWGDGYAECATHAASGRSKYLKIWQEAVDVVESDSYIISNTLSQLGYPNVPVSVNFLSELDPNVILISAFNGDIIYNCVDIDLYNRSSAEEQASVEEGDIAKATAIVEAAVARVFSNYEVSYDGSVISAIFWEDGLALLTDKAIAGNESSLAKWNELVGSIEAFSFSVANELESAGITDIAALMMLVDDRNTDMVLVAAAGGYSFSDRVALSGETSNGSSVTQAPPTFSRSDSGSSSGISQSSAHKTTYVLNADTKKFHYSSCSFAPKSSSGNRATYTGTRAEVIAKGYSPCGHCDP